MTLSETAVEWMFFAVVLLSALAMVTNYFIAKLFLTGRAAAFERRPQGRSDNVAYLGHTRESER